MKLFFHIGLVLLSVNVSAQSLIKNYVQQNSIKVSTVQPEVIDYTDLEQIGNAIGDAGIVLLGEQDHGDAPAFLAKTRIIKYLHEKKGFNVLAFESDFFGLNKGWDELIKSEPLIDSFIYKNIFPIWTACDGCKNLFYDYLPATYKSATPLTLTGFDSQLILGYSRKNLTRDLDSLMRALELPITKESGYATVILPLIDSLKKYKLSDTTQYAPQYNYLLRIKAELGNVLPANDFWLLMADNLIACNIQWRSIKDYNIIMNNRDAQMAANPAWLYNNKFKGQKIIVWAHNFHISKYAGHYENKYVNKWRPMGTVFDSLYKIPTYTIGFTSFAGKAGRLLLAKKYKVQKPAANSFERWINSDYDFAFTDFKKFNAANPLYQDPFSMKGSSQRFHRNETAQWNKIFDGVFFIRDMYPCNDIF